MISSILAVNYLNQKLLFVIGCFGLGAGRKASHYVSKVNTASSYSYIYCVSSSVFCFQF